MDSLFPIRIQKSRQHKQVSPNGLPIKSVSRPGKWGNPFKVGDTVKHSDIGMIWFPDEIELDTIEKVLIFYEKWLNKTEKGRALMELAKTELKGCNLSCWCKTDQCHASILLRIANQ